MIPGGQFRGSSRHCSPGQLILLCLTPPLRADALKDAKTVVWNGPMGVFEFPKFAAGTTSIANTLAGLTPKGTTTIIGGGDSVAAAEQAGVADKISHVSTGGERTLWVLWAWMCVPCCASPQGVPVAVGARAMQAARRWSCWRARSCPAWRRSTRRSKQLLLHRIATHRRRSGRAGRRAAVFGQVLLSVARRCVVGEAC